MRALVEKADVVIVEVNPALPWCHGPDNAVHESEVDFVIEGDGVAAAQLPGAVSTDVDLAIARLVAAEIRNGDCIPARASAGCPTRLAVRLQALA